MNMSVSLSKSGLKGLQTNLDVVAHNIANANTTGFKQSKVSFNELLLNDLSPRQVNLSADFQNGTINRGVRASVSGVDQTPGSFIQTNQKNDLVIHGAGFFATRDAGNQLLLTRNGNFNFGTNRVLMNSQGQPVEVNYVVPQGQWPAGEPTFSQDGSIMLAGQRVGQIVLYQPENMNALIPAGENQFRVANGVNLRNSTAAPQGFGQIQAGFLESSNVDLAESMTELIVTQREYSLNNRVLQATDEMMQRINEFK